MSGQGERGGRAHLRGERGAEEERGPQLPAHVGEGGRRRLEGQVGADHEAGTLFLLTKLIIFNVHVLGDCSPRRLYFVF